MTEIRSSASYVRHEPRRQLDREQVLRSLRHRTGFQPVASTAAIWELLETPQTVHSLARALASRTDQQLDACEGEVLDVLDQLYEADLIEVAPDS
jgi:hypothetical protein